MKLLAFLRDSYREAISGWVLQVMLVLATILIILIASVSFRPVGLKDELDRGFQLFNAFLSKNAEFGNPSWAIENYSETNQIEPWKSDYSFEVVVTCASQADLDKLKDKSRGSPIPATRASTERFIRQSFNYLDNIEVKTVEPKKAEPKKNADAKKDDPKDGGPAEARYLVTTKGTQIKEVMAWRHEPSVLFAFDIPLLTMSLREGVYLMQQWLVNKAGAWIALMVSVIITAGFIPNMLGKGTIDLLVSKPVNKPTLLVYKYIGGLLFMFVLASYTGVGVWLVTGLRTGIWSSNFLAIIPILTFYFAILYAVSTLAAVLTRSTIVAILASLIAWAFFWGVGKVNDGIQNRKDAESTLSERLSSSRPPTTDEDGAKQTEDDILRKLDPNAPLWGVLPKTTFPVFTAVHAVSPRNYELDSRLGRVIAAGVLTEREMKEAGYGKDPRENWAEMILVSTLFIVMMLGLAAWRMITRDG